LTPEDRLTAEDDGPALFERANNVYDSGDYEQALRLFEQAIAKGVTGEVVYNNKGAALDALGRREEAARSYRSAVGLRPSYELAWHNLGNCLYSQDDNGGAVEAYRNAAALNPRRVENHSGLAMSYLKLGRLKKANEAVYGLTPLADSDHKVLLTQARLYIDAGFTDLATGCCQRYIAFHKDSPEGYSLLGAANHDAGKYYEAIRAFESVVELNPGSAEAWNNMGFSYFTASHVDRAIECFEMALSIDPGYKNAWYNKGYALHGADRLEGAVECYLKALEIDKTDKVLWNNLGNALYNLGRFGESIPRFVSALEVDPDYEIAWNNIGNALERMSMYSEAIPYHERSLEIRPDFDYALYAKGVCKAATGAPEEGYDLILQSLDLNPGYEDAWKAKSRVARQLGRLDEALSAAEQALQINPMFDEGWIDRGDILMEMGEPEDAMASYTRALEALEDVQPRTATGMSAATRKAELLSRLGRFPEAIEILKELVLAVRYENGSVERLFDLLRLSGETLPREDLDAMVARVNGPRSRLTYARYLLELGDPRSASSVLDGIPEGALLEEVAVARAVASAALGDAGAAGRALATSPAHGRVHTRDMVLAELAEARCDLEGALRAFRRAMDSGPSDFSAALSTARVAAKLGHYKAAIEAADIASGIDPGAWEPCKVKAEVYSKTGDPKRSARWSAIARVKVALAGIPEDLSGSDVMT
jgi:tetratricopeptide (TPR) repeat protein